MEAKRTGGKIFFLIWNQTGFKNVTFVKDKIWLIHRNRNFFWISLYNKPNEYFLKTLLLHVDVLVSIKYLRGSFWYFSDFRSKQYHSMNETILFSKDLSSSKIPPTLEEYSSLALTTSSENCFVVTDLPVYPYILEIFRKLHSSFW